MERREFIQKSAKSTITMETPPLIFSNSNWKGANDRVNVAVIGIRGMGQSHIQAYQQLENVEVTALCDVDENLFAEHVKKHFTDKGLREPGESGKGEGNHYQNFIDAIRANDPGLLTAPIEEGFYSCVLIHLANISYRLGRTLDINPETLVVMNDEEANRMFKKKYREPYSLPVNI